MFEEIKQKLDPLGASLSRFWLWWTHELSVVVDRFSNSRTDHETERDRRAVVFDLSSGNVSILIQEGDEQNSLGSFTMAAPDVSLFAEVKAHLTDNIQVIIRLPKKYCLYKRLTLPKVDKADIRAVLHNQIDRLTPYKAEQVYFDYRIIEGKISQGKRLIDLYILPRNICTDLMELLKTQNITVDCLLYEAGAGVYEDGAGQRINFLRPLDYLPRRKNPQSNMSRKIGAIGALVAAIYIVPLGYYYVQTEVLTTKIAALSVPAKTASQVKNRYDKLKKEARFLVNKKTEKPLTIQLVNEVSKVLQDDSWLDQLTLKGDRLQIFGYSDSASKVLNVLEKSTFFKDAHFMAAVVYHKKLKAERFHIAVTVEPDQTITQDKEAVQ